MDLLIQKYLEILAVKQGSSQNDTAVNTRLEAEVMVAVSGSWDLSTLISENFNVWTLKSNMATNSKLSHCGMAAISRFGLPQKKKDSVTCWTGENILTKIMELGFAQWRSKTADTIQEQEKSYVPWRS